MAGLNNIREAYSQVYAQLDERMDPEERALRRAEIADKKSSRTDSKVASKYADSEQRSSEKEDKKSRGRHIHGMTDSVELEGDLVDEAKNDSYLETDMNNRQKNNAKAVKDMKKTKAHADMVKAASRHFEEFTTEAKNKEGKEQGADGKACWKGYRYAGTEKGKDKCVKSEEFELDERALDPAETKEKERLVTGMKKSAKDFKKRYGKRATSVMYATATKKAKEHMDTSRSDRRYSVEEVEPSHKVRTPSQIAKREKLTRLLNQIKSKKDSK